MKLIIVGLSVLVVACQALTDEQKQKVAQYQKHCLETSSVEPSLIDKARKGEFTEDEKLKQFVSCMFKKTGFQNEKGEIQIDVIKAKLAADLSGEEGEKVFGTCKDKKGNDEKDTAYLVYKCYFELTPNHISLA